MAGFRTPAGERAIGEILTIHGSEVRIPQGQPVLLERGDIRVALTYEPKAPSSRDGKGNRVEHGFSTLTPDIHISIKRGNSTAKHFILDAKYRDYLAQHDSARAEDLVRTALLKYFDGLRTVDHPDRVFVTSSLIVHSDPSPQGPNNDFWGGIPAEDWLPTASLADLDMTGLEGIRNHSVGLVRLRPGDGTDFQLGRLIDLLLQYHVGASGFECPRCGMSLQAGDDVLISRKVDLADADHERRYILKAQREGWQTSILCICPNCSNYWFQNHCGQGHPLYKTGRRSYHQPSRHKWPTPGMYICPTCGDDPPPDDFLDRSGHRNPTRLEQKGWSPAGLQNGDFEEPF